MHDTSLTQTSSDPRNGVAATVDDGERLIAELASALSDPSLSRDDARRLARAAEDAAWEIRRRRDADAMRRMRVELERQASLVRRLAADMIRTRATIGGALSAAQAGVFECSLRDEKLTWTNGVYDLFGIPAGARLHREDTVGCYTHASRIALDQARDAAIRTGAGFRLDAEIETMKGARRWIRLNCVVDWRDGVPVRLYGLKQDVTDERAAAETVRRLAEVDALTGLANRRLFQDRLAQLAEDRDAALLLVDLDGFKRINDSFGHLTGDECLKEAAARLKRACRAASLVARIGGDEFAVLFPAAGLDLRAIERVAQHAVEALRIPVKRGDFQLELGASVGLARADGTPPSEWMARADVALYAAKASGRGAFRSFEPSMVERLPQSADFAVEPIRLAG